MSPKDKQTHNKKVNSGRTLVEMDPSDIFFTHSRIRPQFTGCNKMIQETLDEITEGRTKIDQIPYITVIENFEKPQDEDSDDRKSSKKRAKSKCGEPSPYYFSLNNRRLFLFKTLRSMGLVERIKVHVKPALPREAEKYTRDRCVLMAKVMPQRKLEQSEGEHANEQQG